MDRLTSHHHRMDSWKKTWVETIQACNRNFFRSCDALVTKKKDSRASVSIRDMKLALSPVLSTRDATILKIFLSNSLVSVSSITIDKLGRRKVCILNRNKFPLLRPCSSKKNLCATVAETENLANCVRNEAIAFCFRKRSNLESIFLQPCRALW
jgi:hypothetical protein